MWVILRIALRPSFPLPCSVVPFLVTGASWSGEPNFTYHMHHTFSGTWVVREGLFFFIFKGLIFSVKYKKTTWWLARWRLESGYQGTETQGRGWDTAAIEIVWRGLSLPGTELEFERNGGLRADVIHFQTLKWELLPSISCAINFHIYIFIYDSIINILNVEFTCFNAFLCCIDVTTVHLWSSRHLLKMKFCIH